ncbi:hypothetical protein Bca52824_009943 [Brassica carinata]|uniref:Uncharacterized protein n=1 Tax=Brassica carinata TaxID=52824 RepID=A0A8X7WDL5_BRACI|nr:hypothetical protein Bca52824_009943 [Brassica carinata]
MYNHLANREESNNRCHRVSIAGRIVAPRAFEKLAFLTLREDSVGTIQLCEKERLSEALKLVVRQAPDVMNEMSEV